MPFVESGDERMSLCTNGLIAMSSIVWSLILHPAAGSLSARTCLSGAALPQAQESRMAAAHGRQWPGTSPARPSRGAHSNTAPGRQPSPLAPAADRSDIRGASVRGRRRKGGEGSRRRSLLPAGEQRRRGREKGRGCRKKSGGGQVSWKRVELLMAQCFEPRTFLSWFKALRNPTELHLE